MRRHHMGHTVHISQARSTSRRQIVASDITDRRSLHPRRRVQTSRFTQNTRNAGVWHFVPQQRIFFRFERSRHICQRHICRQVSVRLILWTLLERAHCPRAYSTRASGPGQTGMTVKCKYLRVVKY